MIKKFLIRLNVKFQRFFSLYKFFFFLTFNKTIKVPRGIYNSTKSEPLRAKIMREYLIKQIIKFKKNSKKNEKFNLLEVGSYIGSSTLIFGDTLQKYLGEKFNIICIDPFQSYVLKNEKEWGLVEFSKGIEQMFFYFNYNISQKKWRSNLILLRKSRKQAEDFLKNSKLSFDFLYIDGSHFYKDVKYDLESYSKMLKKKKNYNGLLCGDDLLFSYEEILRDFNFKKKEVYRFFKRNLKKEIFVYKNKYFSPGVTLAIYEYKKKHKINILKKNGFWYKDK